jgi:hypothetical protein
MSAFDPENIALPELPTARDALFQSAADGWENACLSCGSNKWITYELGYKEAADLLVAQIECGHRYQDLLVYPIVNLYRHYLELAIKGLIRQAQSLLGDPVEVPAHHRISDLWTTCSALLDRICPGDSVEQLRQVGRLLREFSTVDPTSEAFRYPMDKKGNPTLPSLQYVDLSNVRNVIAKVAVMLNGASAQMDYCSDCNSESY